MRSDSFLKNTKWTFDLKLIQQGPQRIDGRLCFTPAYLNIQVWFPSSITNYIDYSFYFPLHFNSSFQTIQSIQMIDLCICAD